MIKAALLQALITISGSSRVLLEPHAKLYASIDQSTNVKASLPLAVVKVQSVSELIAISQTCIKFRVPIVVRASGSGKSGGAVASESSICIDISALNKIISIDRENLIAELEPGVILGEFQERVKEYGLFYPPDPASQDICSIAGNIAENAGGPCTLKYGVTRDYFLGGQALLANGALINFGKRCPKGVAGYDIASLLCGSEGTLAIFTKIILRLIPWPSDQAQGLFLFANEHEALMSVPRIFSAGFRPKILEYIDEISIKALKKNSNLDFITPSLKAALLIECDSSLSGYSRIELEAIKKSCLGVKKFIGAYTLEEQKVLRNIRASLSAACTNYLGFKISEDIAVPIGKLADFRAWFKEKAWEKNLESALFGHAGDGNLHVQILFGSEDLRISAQALRHEVLLYVLKLGGTLSAEHGIGLQKIDYLSLEQEPELIELQKRIKYAFDPHNLLNPGKIFRA